MVDKTKLYVRVNSPAKIIWEGNADSVSSENSEGPFDILPMHTNFLSIIENKSVVIKAGNEEKKYEFKSSVIYATENKVNIYTDI